MEALTVGHGEVRRGVAWLGLVWHGLLHVETVTLVTMVFAGIDVGKGGGVAFIDERGVVLQAAPMPETDSDILELLFWAGREMTLIPCRGVLEKVHASPQMGVTSAFSFGASYGALRMALAAARMPFDEVSPFKWQRKLECISEGDKRVTKARAQQLFPHVKVTHALADALLLAEYGRRVHAPHLVVGV